MGNNVVISAQTGEANQRFYYDYTYKVIRTLATSGRALNVANNGSSNNLEINSVNSAWW
jgi:hypothetical protein